MLKQYLNNIDQSKKAKSKFNDQLILFNKIICNFFPHIICK